MTSCHTLLAGGLLGRVKRQVLGHSFSHYSKVLALPATAAFGWSVSVLVAHVQPGEPGDHWGNGIFSLILGGSYMCSLGSYSEQWDRQVHLMQRRNSGAFSWEILNFLMTLCKLRSFSSLHPQVCIFVEATRVSADLLKKKFKKPPTKTYSRVFLILQILFFISGSS